MILKIGNEKYIGQCNALSYIFFKRIFKTNILDELYNLKKCIISLSKKENLKKNTEELYLIITKFIYILIYTNSKEIESFEKWKSKIEILNEDIVNEVIDIILENFVDEKVEQELKKIENETVGETIFPEHDFLMTCISLNLTIQDLKELTYIDVAKMIISSLDNKKTKKFKKATQTDWDRLAAM